MYPQAGDVLQVVHGDGGDAKAALAFGCDQGITDQARQRAPAKAPAPTSGRPGADVGAQQLPGSRRPDNVGAQPGIGLLGQGARCFAAADSVAGPARHCIRISLAKRLLLGACGAFVDA